MILGRDLKTNKEPLRASELVAILEDMIRRHGNRIVIMDADHYLYLPDSDRIGPDVTGEYIFISGSETINEEDECFNF